MANENNKMSVGRRSLLANLMLAGTAGLALSACGGGGGGSDDSRNLRAAFERLKPGMTYEQVISAVGWAPNEDSITWDNGEEYLIVTFANYYNDGIWVITTAVWGGGGRSERRSYVE
ncbi:hypothetical protein ACS5NL_13005 [Hydrogenophaga sp. MI9]